MVDWGKSTVTVLKAELKSRGLATTGLKAELVERLSTSDQESVAQNDAPMTEEAEQLPASLDQNPSVDASDVAQDATQIQTDVGKDDQLTIPTASTSQNQQDAPESIEPAAPQIPVTATSINTQPSVDTQEVMNDLENRKKRSRSPPPSVAHTPRKRARQDESLPFTNVDGGGHKDEIQTSQADKDWVEKHNGVQETVTNADPAVSSAREEEVDVAHVDDTVNSVQDKATDESKEEPEQNPSVDTEDQAKIQVAQADIDWVEKHNNVDEEMVNAESKEVAPAGEGVEPGPTVVDVSKQDVVVENAGDTVQQDDAGDMKMDDPIPSSPTQSRDARFKGLFNGSTQDNVEDTTAYTNDRDQEHDRSVEPAIHPATSALYIRNFQRPLNLASLKEHIILVATPPGADSKENVILNIFLDPLRTHAFIEFASVSAASRVRSEMHDRVWPPEVNRASLWADFIPSDKVAEWISTEQSSGSRPSDAKKWEIHYGVDEDGNTLATLQQASSVPAARRQSSMQEAGRTSTFGNMPAPPSGPRADQFSSRAPPSGPRVSANHDPNTKSTTALPVIYYQPVPKSLANSRLDSIERALSKRLYDIDTAEINRYSFERGDVLIDRGEERFAGIRPPPGRGAGYMGNRGGGGYRGRNDVWRGGRDRYESSRYGSRDDGRFSSRNDRSGGYDRRNDRYDDRRDRR